MGYLRTSHHNMLYMNVNNSEQQYHSAFAFAFKAELYVGVNATKPE